MTSYISSYTAVSTEETGNINKVPKKQWKKWTVEGKRAFNSMFELMVNNQELFLHPKTPEAPVNQWQTTAWNVSWECADFVSRKVSHI